MTKIQIILSLISGLIGAVLGVWASFKLKNDELKLYEKATALSIVEELKVLLEVYQNEFEDEFNKLDNKIQYLTIIYSVTQDFTTVYTQNAGEIGLIKNETLRKLIIKSYIYLKKYIENLLIYKDDYIDFEEKRTQFICKLYPHLINSECSRTNNEIEITKIKNNASNQEWDWLKSTKMKQAQVINFIISDNNYINHLSNDSISLKNEYERLKHFIELTYSLANDIYKGK